MKAGICCWSSVKMEPFFVLVALVASAEVRLAALLLLAVTSVIGSSYHVKNNNAICDNKGLARIPQDLPETILSLSLSSNPIQNISATDLLRYRQLQQLIMKESQLSSVHEEAFRFLGDLTIVDLSNNDITTISKYIFTQNRKLNSVSLQGNKLPLDPSSPFLISSSVEYLDLTDCGIQQISSLTFSRMEKMISLVITDNNILHLDPEAFQHNSLKILYIDPAEEIKSSLDKICRDITIMVSCPSSPSIYCPYAESGQGICVKNVETCTSRILFEVSVSLLVLSVLVHVTVFVYRYVKRRMKKKTDSREPTDQLNMRDVTTDPQNEDMLVMEAPAQRVEPLVWPSCDAPQRPLPRPPSQSQWSVIYDQKYESVTKQ